MKVCKKCHIEKGDGEFYTHLNKNKTKRVLNSECKICKYDRQKELRQREYDSRQIETHRVCKKCKVLKPIIQYKLKLCTGKKGQKVRYRSKSCKSCENKLWQLGEVKRRQVKEYDQRQKNKNIRWRNNNQERAKEFRKQYVRLDKYKQWYAEYRKKRYENPYIKYRIRELSRKIDKIAIDSISKKYAERLLKHKKLEIHITDEMIKSKQVDIAIFRIRKLIKQLDNEKQN